MEKENIIKNAKDIGISQGNGEGVKIKKGVRKNLKIYLMLVPFTIYMLFIIVFGVVKGFLGSLGYIPELNLNSITLRYYKEVLSDKTFISSFLFTLKYSLISSVLAVVLGLILALYLNKNKKASRWIYSLPIITPHVAVALFTMLILSNTGMLPRLLFALGLLKDKDNFINVISDGLGLGIIITYIWKSAPYVAMTTLSFLEKISKNLEYASLNLGASRIQTFFYVTLPQLKSILLSNFIILFCFIFGTYELPLILGPTSPRALPVLAHLKYMEPILENRPYSLAYNMILIFICLIFSSIMLRGYFRRRE